MKKILLSIALLATLNTNAQLVVDSLGRVGVGTDTPYSQFSVGSSGNSSTAMFCKCNNKKYSSYFKNYTDSITTTYGGYFSVRNYSGDSFGISSLSLGNDDIESSQSMIGISGVAGQAHTSVGVYGGKYVLSGPMAGFAGIYGDASGVSPTFTYNGINYSDSYAGFFRGKVRVTEGIYATLLSPAVSAVPSEQVGTAILLDRGESVTDKLSQVQTLQFLRYDPTKVGVTGEVSTSVLGDADIENMSPEELEELEEVASEAPNHYLSPIQYGLDADQLKAVYPELVYEDANGNVSINYVEMVPLLVQSINELKAELAELKGTSSKKAKTKSETTAIEETTSDVDMVRMDQNKPNPFSESTVITLNIPRETQSASIFIYDMSGKQVQSLPVAERGVTDITVYARDLTAGMYIYTLVVDGKVSVTRRMIVTLG